MKLMSGTTASKGYVYIASVKPVYYGMAVQSCKSLKEHNPDAHVTLFTHEHFVTEDASIFDSVITGIPYHVRAKMWGMANTPYDITCYIDCDSLIVHKQVANLFDLIEDNDICYVDIIREVVADRDIEYIDLAKNIDVPMDCSFMVYKKSPLVIDMLNTWFTEFCDQQELDTWPYEFASNKWKPFDTFTLWRVLFSSEPQFSRFKELKLKKLPKRYNVFFSSPRSRYKGPKVILQIDRHAYTKFFTELNSRVQYIVNSMKEFNGGDHSYSERQIGRHIIKMC